MLINETLDLNTLIHCGKILASTLELSKNLLKPGVLPTEIDSEIELFILENGALPSFKNYNGYPYASCISINSQAVHTVPSRLPFKLGDVVKIDIGVSYNGHCTDAARTYVVGTLVPRNVEKLVLSANAALNDGIAQVYSGNRVGDISFAIYKTIVTNGYNTPLRLGGHGIGTSPHQPPYIPNYGAKGSGVELIFGMCLAIEPILIDGPNQVVLGADGWSFYSPGGHISAHVEDTVVVGNKSSLVLTRETLKGDII